MERRLLKATVAGAISNLLLNGALISQYGMNGAAIATVISEVIVFSVAFWGLKEKIHINVSKYLIGSILISTTVALIYVFYIRRWISSVYWEIVIGGTGSIIIYTLLMKIMLRIDRCCRE